MEGGGWRVEGEGEGFVRVGVRLGEVRFGLC